jgi:hypothetical protein
MDPLLLAHAGATLAMTGLIWFVQLVHYPLFLYASKRDFALFSKAHQRRTTWVVAPLMLVEMGSASALLLLVSDPLAQGLAVAGWLILVLIWLSTASIQVPLHRRLSSGYSPAVAQRLVRTNWVRTLGWTARGLLALLLLPR